MILFYFLCNYFFVSLNTTITFPLPPSFFSHHVYQCDMVSLLMDWKLMLKKVPCPSSPSPSVRKTEIRWWQCTVSLMVILGSATKVSLNQLVHHCVFVHHGRDLCVWQWSTLCFYPQMDEPLVRLLLLECIIPLNNFFKNSSILLTCVCTTMLIDLC